MVAFVLLSLVIVALAAISCIPGAQSLYPSLPMILLWGATGIAGLYYIVRRRLYRNGVLFLLHAAFLVILAGAAITHFTATSSDTLARRVSPCRRPFLPSAHAPCSNGEETMQLMAFCALTVCVGLRRRSPSMPPLGMILAALALFVSLMGRSTPQVTQLMPVLNSPLLSVHVLVIMLAYSLLALMALSGAMWLCGRRDMLAVARRLLCPAVFLLAAGIFIGAVWANKSWGRYWGWDPKEVWALITMLVYTFPLHRGIVRVLARDRAFAIFCVLAFLSVLMTYFGVNFFLGGLHAYS